MYLALFRAKICPECGIWPPECLNLNKMVECGQNTKLCIILSCFFFPEGLHCLFQLFLPLFQIIEEHHIDGRELESAVVDFQFAFNGQVFRRVRKFVGGSRTCWNKYLKQCGWLQNGAEVGTVTAVFEDLKNNL